MTVTARVRAGRKTRVDRVEEIFIFLIDEYCFGYDLFSRSQSYYCKVQRITEFLVLIGVFFSVIKPFLFQSQNSV